MLFRGIKPPKSPWCQHPLFSAAKCSVLWVSPDSGATSSFEQLRIWRAWITGELPGCISFNLIRGAVSLRPLAILPAAVAVAAVIARQMLALVRGRLQKKF